MIFLYENLANDFKDYGKVYKHLIYNRYSTSVHI